MLTHNEKTQAPLIAPAVHYYCRLRQDAEFAHEVLPALLSYDEWLWRRRADSKGRFILWHGDESGWDNATRHYPVPAKPFDMQVHCFEQRLALDILLSDYGFPLADDSPTSRRDVQQRCKALAQRLQATRKALKTYWDTNDYWYYDFGAVGDGQRTGKRRKQIAAGGLFSMLVNTANPFAANVCIDALEHERIFACEYPIPTLAKCDPDYSPHGWGWNGPAWLQVNYFTITGLFREKRFEAAFKLWEQTKRLVIRDGKPYSFELYDPETGTGMGCPDYSWQAMINHLIIHRFAGVGFPFLSPALPPGMNQLAISNLPGTVESIAIQRRGKRVRIKVQYSPQVDPTCEQLRPGFGNFPMLIPEGLGAIDKITGNGRAFIKRNTWWEPLESAEPSRTWELIVTCR